MKNIIFFDGVCLLCNGFVDFLHILDKSNKFYYAPLQGKTARSVLDRQLQQLDMVVFRNARGKIFVKSEAVLEIAATLGGVLSILRFFKIIPTHARDWLYDRIVELRYDWFGKRDTCRMPEYDKNILP